MKFLGLAVLASLLLSVSTPPAAAAGQDGKTVWLLTLVREQAQRRAPVKAAVAPDESREGRELELRLELGRATSDGCQPVEVFLMTARVWRSGPDGSARNSLDQRRRGIQVGRGCWMEHHKRWVVSGKQVPDDVAQIVGNDLLDEVLDSQVHRPSEAEQTGEVVFGGARVGVVKSQRWRREEHSAADGEKWTGAGTLTFRLTETGSPARAVGEGTWRQEDVVDPLRGWRRRASENWDAEFELAGFVVSLRATSEMTFSPASHTSGTGPS